MGEESKDSADSKSADIVLIHGRTADGEGVQGLRSRAGNGEGGEVRPMKEGRPLGEAEVVTLHPREGAPLLCDVKVVYKPPPPRSSSGPPQIASKEYRKQWDRIFGVTN
jgi:hypothetical protein